ncbi:MAG: YtkA-like [Thermomicrobiales bacterium]|nr:YtkA-like [Thermomicrobiales bacterium]
MPSANPTTRHNVRRLGLTMSAVALLVLASWLILPSAQRPTLSATESPTATPACARLTEAGESSATPAALGTPTAAVVCTETGLGTPVAVDGLRVTLTAAQSKAGPVDLTVDVRDSAGQPVDDASVLVLNQHLEMNHGISITEAVHTDSGRYQAEQVPMGMGGHWQVEVQVARPGEPPVAAVFEITLAGPL